MSANSLRPRVNRQNALEDSYYRSRNEPLYDASKSTCPVLAIRGDHDRSSTGPIFTVVCFILTGSRGKRSIMLGDPTHFAKYEWCRDALYSEVQNFIEN